MAALISNQETEECLRACLTAEGYALSVLGAHGQTGVDILAKKGDEEVFIEVIGFKQSPPARAKDFYEVFFRAVSRLVNGAKHCVIALPRRSELGLPARAKHYGEAGRLFQNFQFGLLTLRPDHTDELLGMNGRASDPALKSGLGGLSHNLEGAYDEA